MRWQRFLSTWHLCKFWLTMEAESSIQSRFFTDNVGKGPGSSITMVSTNLKTNTETLQCHLVSEKSQPLTFHAFRLLEFLCWCTFQVTISYLYAKCLEAKMNRFPCAILLQPISTHRLFSNLLSNCTSIVTKSWQHSITHERFIRTKIDYPLKE